MARKCYLQGRHRAFKVGGEQFWGRAVRASYDSMRVEDALIILFWKTFVILTADLSWFPSHTNLFSEIHSVTCEGE